MNLKKYSINVIIIPIGEKINQILSSTSLFYIFIKKKLNSIIKHSIFLTLFNKIFVAVFFFFFMNVLDLLSSEIICSRIFRNIRLYLEAFKVCRKSRTINPIKAIIEIIKNLYNNSHNILSKEHFLKYGNIIYLLYSSLFNILQILKMFYMVFLPLKIVLEEEHLLYSFCFKIL